MARVIAGALGVVAITLWLTGCDSPPESPPSPPAATAAAPTPAIEPPVAAATPHPARQSVPPVRVVAASVGIDVPVVPVGVQADGLMELPPDPAVAGWYRYGADPSSPEGNTVVSAHVDAPDHPIGPFSALRDLRAGDTVDAVDAAGVTHRYSVASVTAYPKAELPVTELFARTTTHALVLITCGGSFDQDNARYVDNVVVVGTPAG